jgi:hypothetical protein
MVINKSLLIIACFLVIIVTMNQALAQKFEAVGPTYPVKQQPMEVGAVKVTFDLLPTTMSFDLPWTYFMITENNIKFANYAAETYDPREFFATGGAASFEPNMDKESRYVRAWIEHQSDARIVVRIRYALANNLYDIAHRDVPSGSPYGKGDWTDEWHYIYPDGTNIRHMKIYTGLAPMSKPFGFNRVPPNMVSEFMESIIHGPVGLTGKDVIETGALTLIRLFGYHSEIRLTEGQSKTISFDPYPLHFDDFRDANIMLFNLKSEYKPFTIAMPYGVRVQQYARKQPYDFFAERRRDKERGFRRLIGHFLNYHFYRRDGNTLEQVYFHGMTNAADPVKELVKLGWSWIEGPTLQMEGFKPEYMISTYDPAQKAYIVPREGRGPVELKFSLEAQHQHGSVEFGAEGQGAPMAIINPTFIVKDWDTPGVELRVDDKLIEPGKDFRIGYEETPTGSDLILWLRMSASKPTQFKLTPVSN